MGLFVYLFDLNQHMVWSFDSEGKESMYFNTPLCFAKLTKQEFPLVVEIAHPTLIVSPGLAPLIKILTLANPHGGKLLRLSILNKYIMRMPVRKPVQSPSGASPWKEPETM